MADENTVTPAAEAAQPTDTTEQDTPPEADPIDWKAEARKWESRAKENKSIADENRQAAAKLKQLEDANKSETEKLNDRATHAETERDQWRGRYMDLAKRQAITEAAIEARTTDPETVYLYLRDEVDIDDDGQVQGVAKALKGLQARKGHLFNTVPAGARDASVNSAPPALNSDALTDALSRAVGL